MASELQDVKEHLETFQKEWKDYRTASDARLVLIESKGHEPAEVKELTAKMDKAVDDAEKKHLVLVKSLDDANKRTDDLEAAARRSAKGDKSEEKSADQIEHKEKLDIFLRTGVDTGLKAIEEKVLRTSVNTDGGYGLTVEREAGILDRIRETSPIRQVAQVRSIGAAISTEARMTPRVTSATERAGPDEGVLLIVLSPGGV